MGLPWCSCFDGVSRIVTYSMPSILVLILLHSSDVATNEEGLTIVDFSVEGVVRYHAGLLARLEFEDDGVHAENGAWSAAFWKELLAAHGTSDYIADEGISFG